MTGLRILFYFALVFLTACGGETKTSSNDGSTIRTPIRPSGTVSGTAFDGLITNGKVTVYDFSTGEKGEELGSDTTDGSGFYEINISTPDKPIYLEICDGRYVEEASGLSVILEDTQCLFGVTNYISGQPVKMALTYFSTMAVGYAQCLMKNSNAPVDSLVISANEMVSNLSGYDITEVQPLDVSLAENATAFINNQLVAGMYAAGISQMMKDISFKNNQPIHQIYNSIYFSNMMYEDIKSDCLLNGLGESGNPLSMGSIPVQGEHYRYFQSKGMLEFINSTRNQTSLSVNDFDENILRFNSITNATTVTSATNIEQGTGIVNFIPSNSSVVNETITVSAQLNDVLGILETRFFLNGNEIGLVSRSDNPSIEIDTTVYGTGKFDLTIEVTNDLLVKTSQTHSITFSNTAPIITNLSPANTDIVGGEVEVSATIDSDIKLSYVKFFLDGSELISFDNPEKSGFSHLINTSVLTDRNYQLLVRTEDIVGQISEQTSIITVDNTPPVVNNFVPTENEIITGRYTIRAEVSDVSGIKDVTFLINGDLLNNAGDLLNPQQSFTSTSFSDGFYTISIVVTDNSGKTTTVTRNVRISNTPLTFQINTERNGSYLLDDYSRVSVNRTIDQIQSFEVIGQIKYSSRTVTITQPGGSISLPGWSETKLECYDKSQSSSRNEFAKITINVTDYLGVKGSQTWSTAEQETCYGQRIRRG